MDLPKLSRGVDRTRFVTVAERSFGVGSRVRPSTYCQGECFNETDCGTSGDCVCVGADPECGFPGQCQSALRAPSSRPRPRGRATVIVQC